MRSDSLKALAVDAVDSLKAFNTVVLDVRELTDVTDYMVVTSGRSSRQVAAIAEHLIERAKESGVRAIGVEGLPQGEWVLIDLCDVVVHVMLPDVRSFYMLEKLWAEPAGDQPSLAGPVE